MYYENMIMDYVVILQALAPFTLPHISSHISRSLACPVTRSLGPSLALAHALARSPPRYINFYIIYDSVCISTTILIYTFVCINSYVIDILICDTKMIQQS